MNNHVEVLFLISKYHSVVHYKWNEKEYTNRREIMKLFLTSSPIGIYRSEEPLDYIGFNPANGMVEALKKYWKDDSRCLLISAFPEEYEVNDRMRADYEHIVRDTGLSISCMDICDARNGKETADDLLNYDFVILGGGHVPTENAFFRRIDLSERIHDLDGIVMGISAGTMNCARVVYAQPELPGEASDPAYERFIPGLGLTEYNILPHYNAVKNDIVDGMRLIEDIAFGDSFGHTFYAITDGSFLLQTETRAEICGEAYMIHDGRIDRICGSGETFILRGRIEEITVHGTAEMRTEQLNLRRYRPDDAEELYQRFGTDPDMYKYSGWNPYATPEMARKTVQSFIDSYDDEHSYSWVMDVDDIVVGTIGAYDYMGDQIEVGFSVSPRWQGRGVATEALEKVLEYLTENEGIPCVTAWCAAENGASRKVLEKSGMQLVRTEKNGLTVGDRVYDKMIYNYYTGSDGQNGRTGKA